jgi:hypothetical protein
MEKKMLEKMGEMEEKITEKKKMEEKIMEKKMLEKMGEKVKFTEIMKKIKIILNKKDLKKYISNFY